VRSPDTRSDIANRDLTQIQVNSQHRKTEIKKVRKHFVRHLVQLIVAGMGLGAGVSIAADAFQPAASLALIGPAFVIGGISFVLASIAIDNLPHDYTSLRKLRRETTDR
jgi:formate/nitrite transporter FocA (FNT family)